MVSTNEERFTDDKENITGKDKNPFDKWTGMKTDKTILFTFRTLKIISGFRGERIDRLFNCS